MTCHMYDWQTISHICKMRLLIEMPSDQKVRRCCILLEFCSMLNTSASRTTSKESRKSERGERGGAEAIRGTINSFGFLCSFSSFALHNSQFLNLNGRKQRGERRVREVERWSTGFDSVDRKMSVPCNEANK